MLKVDPEGFRNGIGLPDLRLSLCLLLSWTLVFIVQAKGVRSSGRAAYFTALFPYLVLVAILIRGVTLPGALDGIMFFLAPRWELLLSPGVSSEELLVGKVTRILQMFHRLKKYKFHQLS